MLFNNKKSAARLIAVPLLLSFLLPAGSYASASPAPGSPAPAVLTIDSVSPMNARDLTLAEAIELAVARHPLLETRRAQLQGAEARIGAAEAPYYPQIGADFGNALIKPSNQNDPGGLTLKASQLLYDFGKTASDVDAAKMGTESAQQTLLETRLLVAETIATLYNDRLRFVQLIEVLEQNYEMLQQIREVSELRATAGLNSRSDIQLADVRMSDVHATRANYRAQLRSIESRLTTLLGVRPARFAPLPEGLIQRVQGRNSVDWDSMPQIRAASANVQAAQARVKSVEAGLLPSLHLQASTRGLNPLSSHGDNRGPDNTVMLVLRSDNLFEGGAGKARVSAALAEVAAAASEVETLKFSIEQSFTDLHSDLHGAQDRARIYGNQLQQATLERDTYREEYTLGKRTLNNLLDAQRNIMNAETQRVTSAFDALRTAIRLAKLTQILPAYVAQTLPPLLPPPAMPDTPLEGDLPEVLRNQPPVARAAIDTIVETVMDASNEKSVENGKAATSDLSAATPDQPFVKETI